METPPAELIAAELAALSQGDPLRAAVHLSAQHQHSPNDPEVCAALGLAFAATGEPDAACRVLERAHYLAPAEARYLYLQGLALETAGRPAEAALRYAAALRLQPDHPGAQARRAALESAPDAGGESAPSPARPPAPSEAAALVRPAPRPQSAPAPRPQPRPAPPRPPEPRPEWTPPPPGFAALLRATLQLWTAHPLLWLLLLGLPNALAVGAVPREPEFAVEAVLIWIAAFGLGAALVLTAMTAQWITGRRGGLPPAAVGGSVLLCVPYLLLTLGPWCVLVALRAPAVSLEVNLLGTLLLTAPFHALLAPALALAARGEGATGALRAALRLAGRRTWLHLAVLLTAGIVIGGAGAALAWSFVVSMQGGGEIVAALLQVAGVTLGQSLWAVLVAVCGVDAVAAAPPGRLGPGVQRRMQDAA
jgi:hypothetical protein